MTEPTTRPDHVMLDLETLGVTTDSVILSIGAVTFDPFGTQLYDKFHVHLDVDEQLEAGRKVSCDTIMWWMRQSEEARSGIYSVHRKENRLPPVMQSLMALKQWMPPHAKVWGNGASFDNAMLASLFKAFKIPVPWDYWCDRCYRTFKSEFPSVKLERRGTHHNALDDAISQALHLQAIYKVAGILPF